MTHPQLPTCLGARAHPSTSNRPAFRLISALEKTAVDRARGPRLTQPPRFTRAAGGYGTGDPVVRSILRRQRCLNLPGIPVNRFRFSRYRDPMGPDVFQWQEWQIVQSQFDLRDFLP